MLSSPPRLLAPISPYNRPSSPTMSPGGRRGRALGSADESHLRDLSPNTTLRAFTQRPMPYDVTRDEYKIFACIENLTPAERDLGARVAKAAQRLKNWCDEIGQWGWSGSFEQPSEEYKERRRRSLQTRIEEHIKEAPAADEIPPLEYWGSLLSVEVQAHEARLDEISDDLLSLDVEELKGHVLDMHPGSRSRPSSAGYGASRSSYKPMDDFNFLITQTLISALPHHFQLKERLQTWTARVTVLREAPRYLDDLKTAQKAMRLGWEALGPPKDPSDDAFDTWKKTVDTISGVMRDRVSDLGRRLDTMLDSLEGHEDCLPDRWIDVFEGVEGDFGRWTQESRRKVIEFDVRRHGGPSGESMVLEGELVAHSDNVAPTTQADKNAGLVQKNDSASSADGEFKPDTTDEHYPVLETAIDETSKHTETEDDVLEDESVFEEGDTVIHNEIGEDTVGVAQSNFESTSPTESQIIVTSEDGQHTPVRPHTPRSRRESMESISSDISYSSSPPSAFSPSPSVRNATNRSSRAPRPALNAAMPKRRKNDTESSVEERAPWPPTQFSHTTPTTADDFERKISDVLSTIPAHIRLTSRNGADARNPKASRAVSHKGSKGYLRAARSVSGMKSPELTLSPVKEDFDSAKALSGRRSTASLRGDNDIRMYHLTQPGKEHPVKLFIRRVGENGERVMVRVGGGWADLGEYLRQYAEHHGRRTASNGQFEILGLEVGADLSPNRSESVMSSRNRRASGGSQVISPTTTPNRPSTRTGISTNEPPPPMPHLSPTPTPTSSNETSGTPASDSSRRSWRGEEVGLAGPKSKKIDLDNEKAEWVEGMMKQARSVSGNLMNQFTPQNQTHNGRGESRSESRSESRNESRTSVRGQASFGDLGKVGGTKRIFMRGGPAQEH
ncbi:uncharacterized protein N0V89_004167 [Didymosphaeria variabile]|uniref:GAR domain-containing protein n=1 Tax=Didymosphaeria variabile TaxID=1932322 RepID=A0A9W9CC65_9PLEO|nr:uncharacterized protein N0V89_004167 [Didymosphaeria variabile]KAJ4356139.1 hypothetical protein N0V89_004167 [Didymosphaeria variabile]